MTITITLRASEWADMAWAADHDGRYALAAYIADRMGDPDDRAIAITLPRSDAEWAMASMPDPMDG